MVDGIYSITYRGAADWGMGMLILRDGIVTGADTGGITYDGTYQDLGDRLKVALTTTVPPGTPLVQGVPAQPKAYTFPINVEVPKSALQTNEPVLMDLPPGPVNVIFRLLRPLET